MLRSRWEQRRLGKAASLLRDRNFVKGPGAKSPARDEHTSSRFFIRASIYQWCENPLPPGSAVPLPMSLSSRWQGSEVQINLNRIRRKTAKIHSRLVLDRGRFGCGYLQSLKSKPVAPVILLSPHRTYAEYLRLALAKKHLRRCSSRDHRCAPERAR